MQDLDLKFLHNMVSGYADELRMLAQSRVPPELVDIDTMNTMRTTMDDVILALEDHGSRRYLTALPGPGEITGLRPVDLLLRLKPYIVLLEQTSSSAGKSRK